MIGRSARTAQFGGYRPGHENDGPAAGDLHTIEVWLAGHAPASHGALRPGLDRAGLATLESAYGFDLHPEFRALLSWHDGCERVDQGFDIWPDFLFENSADMLERSRAPHHRWSPH